MAAATSTAIANLVRCMSDEPKEPTMNEKDMVEPDTKTLQEMAKRAKAISKRAYCPYSMFRVGAVVLTDDGQMFEGCNVENASPGVTICAERTAVFQMIAWGKRKIVAVVTYTATPEPAAPCGACRQVINEFGPDALIMSVCDGTDSKLKQALRLGREREPFGILWDVRHWKQDLQKAILHAREGAPLALAYLDMNGLKQVNDKHGHDDGDLALKIFFQTVASALGDRGEAYRLGGDEVLVVLPKHDEQAAVQKVRLACTKLMNERLWSTDPNSLLSIAVGVITCTDPGASPEELRSAADEEQKRAKERSKETTPRPSVIAIKGKEDMLIIRTRSGVKSRRKG